MLVIEVRLNPECLARKEVVVERLMEGNAINLYVGNSSSGERVYENLPVTPLGNNKYKILSSPGLVLGIAKDDEIQYFPDSGEFDLISRGRNLCIQLYLSPNGVKDLEMLTSQIKNELEGTIDGFTKKQAVFSVPVKIGFSKLEKILNQFVQTNPDCKWYYGNVYDIADGVTPLNWWC